MPGETKETGGTGNITAADAMKIHDFGEITNVRKAVGAIGAHLDDIGQSTEELLKKCRQFDEDYKKLNPLNFL